MRDGERIYKGKSVYELSLRNKNQQDALFYSQSISVINLYMFRTCLLLIIRRYYSVYTAIGIRICHAFILAASQHKRMTHDMLTKIIKMNLVSIIIIIIIHLYAGFYNYVSKQTMFLGYTVLQLICIYNSCYM